MLHPDSACRSRRHATCTCVVQSISTAIESVATPCCAMLLQQLCSYTRRCTNTTPAKFCTSVRIGSLLGPTIQACCSCLSSICNGGSTWQSYIGDKQCMLPRSICPSTSFALQGRLDTQLDRDFKRCVSCYALCEATLSWSCANSAKRPRTKADEGNLGTANKAIMQHTARTRTLPRACIARHRQSIRPCRASAANDAQKYSWDLDKKPNPHKQGPSHTFFSIHCVFLFSSLLLLNVTT